MKLNTTSPAHSAANVQRAARRYAGGGILTIHHARITAAAGHTGSKYDRRL